MKITRTKSQDKLSRDFFAHPKADSIEAKTTEVTQGAFKNILCQTVSLPDASVFFEHKILVSLDKLGKDVCDKDLSQKELTEALKLVQTAQQSKAPEVLEKANSTQKDLNILAIDRILQIDEVLGTTKLDESEVGEMQDFIDVAKNISEDFEFLINCTDIEENLNEIIHYYSEINKKLINNTSSHT